MSEKGDTREVGLDHGWMQEETQRGKHDLGRAPRQWMEMDGNGWKWMEMDGNGGKLLG
jgi:hypothetical protein